MLVFCLALSMGVSVNDFKGKARSVVSETNRHPHFDCLYFGHKPFAFEKKAAGATIKGAVYFPPS